MIGHESRAWTTGRVIRSLILSDARAREFLSDRVYPVVAPEGSVFPLCIYRLDSTDRNGAHMVGNAGHATRTFEVAFHGQNYDALDEYATEFRERVESWRGVEGELKVRRVDIIDESDGTYDRPEGGADDPIFSRVFVVTLQQIETTTSLPSGSYGG